MRLAGRQVVGIIVFVVVLGFGAFSMFVSAARSTTPTRFWGFIFGGLYVATLMMIAIFYTLTEDSRKRSRAGLSVRERTRGMLGWLLFAFVVALSFFFVGIFTDTPFVMEVLLAANIVLLAAWLLLVLKVRSLPGAGEPPGQD